MRLDVFAWFAMVAIAVGSGVVREAWYGKNLGEVQVYQVSTFSALVLLGPYVAWVTRRWRPRSGARAIGVGAVWLGLTLAFEVLFGHCVAGHSWARLAQDYVFLAGRRWPLVLLWVAVAPYLFSRRIRPPRAWGAAAFALLPAHIPGALVPGVFPGSGVPGAPLRVPARRGCPR